MYISPSKYNNDKEIHTTKSDDDNGGHDSSGTLVPINLKFLID